MKRAFFQVMGMLLAMCCTPTWAADEVRLQNASSIVMNTHGQRAQNVRLEAIVKNLGFTKQVVVHYRTPTGEWADLPLRFDRVADDGREVWSLFFAPPVNTNIDLQFVLRYSVNGQTFWDNNHGQNHFIAQDAGAMLGEGVDVDNLYPAAVERIPAGDPRFLGAVALRNIAPLKEVTVVYSTDGWNTVKSVKANFDASYWAGRHSGALNPNGHGVEVWTFNLDVGGATQVEYAIQYIVAGQIQWDNNFGNNYRTVIVRE